MVDKDVDRVVESLQKKFFPVAMKWKKRDSSMGTDNSGSGSSYMQPYKKEGDKVHVVFYDMGRPYGFEQFPKPLFKHSDIIVTGIIISHTDDDHIGGLDKLSTNTAAISAKLKNLKFILFPKPGKKTTHASRIAKIINNLNRARICFQRSTYTTRSEITAFVRYHTNLVIYAYKNHIGNSPSLDTMILYEKSTNCNAVAEVGAQAKLTANAVSLLTVWSYGSLNYLFTGDSNAVDVIKDSAFLSSELNVKKWDLMELPHHGSVHSTRKDEVKYLAPLSEGYFITGSGNGHHPHAEVMSGLVEYANAKAGNKPSVTYLAFGSTYTNTNKKHQKAINAITMFDDSTNYCFLEPKSLRSAVANNIMQSGFGKTPSTLANRNTPSTLAKPTNTRAKRNANEVIASGSESQSDKDVVPAGKKSKSAPKKQI